jgi:hypothetical protein
LRAWAPSAISQAWRVDGAHGIRGYMAGVTAKRSRRHRIGRERLTAIRSEGASAGSAREAVMASRLRLPSTAMLQGGAGSRPGRELEGAPARAGIFSGAAVELADTRPASSRHGTGAGGGNRTRTPLARLGILVRPRLRPDRAPVRGRNRPAYLALGHRVSRTRAKPSPPRHSRTSRPRCSRGGAWPGGPSSASRRRRSPARRSPSA